MIYNICNMVDSEKESDLTCSRELLVSKCLPSLSLSLYLTVSVYINVIVREREDSLSEIRAFPWKLCPSESVWCRVCPLISKLFVRSLSSFSVGQCIWEIQSYDARIFHPYFFVLHTCTQRDRRRDREFLREIHYLSRKKNPRNSTSAGQRVAISHHDDMRHRPRRSWLSSFQALGGCVSVLVVSEEKAPAQNVNKAIYSRSKMRNHTARAQLMMRRRRGRKFWPTVHTFRGFVAVLRATTLSQEGQLEFYRKRLPFAE